jgi:hypothetical protein
MSAPSSLVHQRLDPVAPGSPLEQEIIGLRRACFPEMVGTPQDTLEYWRWKFTASSSGEQAEAWGTRLAETQELIGFYAASPLTYQSPQGPLRAGLVFEVMTSPKARGKGVFTAIGHAATAGMTGPSGFRFLTGYPIRPEVLPGHRKVGWIFREQLPVYVAPCLRLWGALPWLRAKASGLSIERLEDARMLAELPGFEDFRRAWSEQATRERWIAVQNDAAFLRWRYGPPGVRYQAVVVRDREGRLQGYVTGRQMSLKGVPSFAIADIRTLSDSAIYGLTAGLLFGSSLRTLLLAGMFSKTMARAVGLWKVGFVPTLQKFWLILKPEAALHEAYTTDASGRFYLAWGDTDDI